MSTETAPAWKRLPSWVHSHYFFHTDLSKEDSLKLVTPSLANLVSSMSHVEGGTTYHKPLIDLDIRAELIPSTTPGHGHLYIDKLLTADQYGRLLAVLVEVGIVQQGIWDHQWVKEGHTALRLPGIQKKVTEKSSGGPIATPESSSAIPWKNLPADEPNTVAKPKLKVSLSDYSIKGDSFGEEVALPVNTEPNSKMMESTKEFGEIMSMASAYNQPPAEMLGLFFTYLEAKHKFENPEAPPVGVVSSKKKSLFEDLFPEPKNPSPF